MPCGSNNFNWCSNWSIIVGLVDGASLSSKLNLCLVNVHDSLACWEQEHRGRAIATHVLLYSWKRHNFFNFYLVKTCLQLRNIPNVNKGFLSPVSKVLICSVFYRAKSS